ncbi:hypothetical protein KUH03_00045 [Sphingobacterium sp. E70]|nr:hypothetical protein KUH03_00045 [Sphingobacterium sp. E70]
MEEIISKLKVDHSDITIWDVGENYVNDPVSGKLTCLQIKSNKKTNGNIFRYPFSVLITRNSIVIASK